MTKRHRKIMRGKKLYLAKKETRKTVRARAETIPPSYYKETGMAMTRLIRDWPGFRDARSVMAFMPIKGEVDILPMVDLILDSGKTLYLPRVDSAKEGIMSAVEVASLDNLVSGTWGIREPARDKPVAPHRAIDLVIVPCLAASRDGLRMGKGGGFYDRFMKGYRGQTILLCPEAFILDRVPMGYFDIAYTYVLTEEGIYKEGEKIV